MSSASSLCTSISSPDYPTAGPVDSHPIQQPPSLMLDISAAEGHGRGPSTDSGYGSSPSIRSSLNGPAIWRLYGEWKAADDAAQRLPAELQALEACQSLLSEARRARDASRTPARPKRRLSSMSLSPLKKRSIHAAPSVSMPQAAGSTVSGTSSNAPSHNVEELETRVAELQQVVKESQRTAGLLDECFDRLLASLDGECPISPESLRSPSILSSYSGSSPGPDTYRRARKTVAARDEMYLVTRATTEAVRRACRAVQAAYRLYREAKENLDTVCGPEKSKLMVIFSDEESRNKTYFEAATRSQEAQACFDECLKLLQPHWDYLRRPELEAYENLHNTGLLQATTLYKLMYGGPNFAMGIKQEVQVMVQRQSDVFQQLANFAAGVQSCLANCEAVEREARETRDAARRQLVAAYAQADEELEKHSLMTFE